MKYLTNSQPNRQHFSVPPAVCLFAFVCLCRGGVDPPPAIISLGERELGRIEVDLQMVELLFVLI